MHFENLPKDNKLRCTETTFCSTKYKQQRLQACKHPPTVITWFETEAENPKQTIETITFPGHNVSHIYSVRPPPV